LQESFSFHSHLAFEHHALEATTYTKGDTYIFTIGHRIVASLFLCTHHPVVHTSITKGVYHKLDMATFQETDLLGDHFLIFQGGIEQHTNISNDGHALSSDVAYQNPPSSQPTRQTHHHDTELEQNIKVEVSGSRFCIVPSLFHKVEKLKWKKSNGIFKLNANPDVFEMVLQYFLYDSLPDTKNLSHRKATELMQLVAPLEPMAVLPLCEHIQSGFLHGSASTTRNNPGVGGISFLTLGLSNFSVLSSRGAHAGPNTTRKTNNSNTATSDDPPPVAAAPPVCGNPPSSIPFHINMTTSSTNPPLDVVSAPTEAPIVVQDTNPFALSIENNSDTMVNPFAMLGENSSTTNSNPFELLGDNSNAPSASHTKAFSLPIEVLHGEQRLPVHTGQQYPTQILSVDSCDSSSSEGSISKLTQCTQSVSHGVDTSIQDENAHAGPQSFHLPPLDVISPSPSVEVEFTGIPTTKLANTCRPTPLPSTSTLGVQDRNIPYPSTYQLPQYCPNTSSTQDKRPDFFIPSENNMSKTTRKEPSLPLHQRRSTKLIRAVLKGGGGGGGGNRDRKGRKMTHADWCSSEYVL
jgi:hypothetical protein